MFSLLLVLFTVQLQAAPLSLETAKGRIFIQGFSGWELGKDMFGMPFIYFSPQKNGQRSNISFTATGVDVEINLADLGKDKEGYQKMKRAWAQQVGALTQGFSPYKLWKNIHGHAVHEVGFSYLHDGKTYVENSYYVDCRGRLIYSKSLRLEANKEHEDSFNKLIKELDCAL